MAMCLFHDWYYSKKDRYTTSELVRSFRSKHTVTVEHFRSRYCLKCGWKQNYEDRYMLSQLIFWYWAPDQENTLELRQERASKNRGQLLVEEQERDKMIERARIAYQKQGMEWETRNDELVKSGIPRIPFWMMYKFDDRYVDDYEKLEKAGSMQCQ